MSQVCDCWGLSRQQIQEAMKTHGLTTAEQVYDHFEGVECGLCSEDVAAIVAETLQAADTQ
jgi:NAD(P)H-nitrite reductase large subunit